MFGREPRVPVDVMFPSPDHSVIGSSSSPKKYADVLRASLSKSYERVRLYSKKQQHQKQFYDRGARGSPYQVGDIVSLHDPVVKKGHSRKFHRPWKGPFKVVKLLGSTTYRIQDCKNSRKRKVVHFNHLKPAYYQSAPESTPLPKATETDPSERINIMLNSSENDFDNDPDYIVYLPSREELPSCVVKNYLHKKFS